MLAVLVIWLCVSIVFTLGFITGGILIDNKQEAE